MRVKTIAAAYTILIALWFTQGVSRVLAWDAADQAQVQTIITQQIDAFGRGDAAAAHAFASPKIQSMFSGPDGFFAMVKSGFPPLFNPRKTVFAGLEDGPLGTTETVRLIDAGGTLWTALYALIQVDGQWRIDGCSLVATPGETT